MLRRTDTGETVNGVLMPWERGREVSQSGRAYAKREGFDIGYLDGVFQSGIGRELDFFDSGKCVQEVFSS